MKKLTPDLFEKNNNCASQLFILPPNIDTETLLTHRGEGKGSRSPGLSKPEFDSDFQVDVTRNSTSVSPLAPWGEG
ncbi:hypothetical protein [Pseudomonas fluorescens]|uniref:hypothetical protein n=1 Tax=Pseudomonas fluorescens TaxID=294 RepID=UPI003D1A7476